MENKIKELRLTINGLAQLTKELKPFEHQGFTPIEEQFKEGTDGLIEKTSVIYLKTNSKEIEKATDSLFLAKAWLGKMLELLGSKTPYINDGNRKTIIDIEPIAEKSNPYKKGSSFDEFYTPKSHIEKVDWIREEIKQIIDNTEDFSENIDYIELEQGFVYKYLCEARFWLGFELQRIREEK